MRLLLGKDLAHAAAALGRTEPLGSGTGTPAERLSVQISEIAETTRGEERFANETDRALHPTFLVPPALPRPAAAGSGSGQPTRAAWDGSGSPHPRVRARRS